MPERVLVLGATGMLGAPVAHHLIASGHTVRALVRDPDAARLRLGDAIELIAGTATARSDVARAMDGCDAVHINLTQEAELTATEHVTALAEGLERVSYVSATTACEENRWFEVVDVKMRTEHVLARSGLPTVVLCPTWVMETLHNFVHGDRCVVVAGRHPPPLHFFAADDFGRIVADSYADRRAIGKRLYIHGPEAVTLPDALERFFAARHAGKTIAHLSLRQARVVGWLTRREGLRYVTRLIDYFDRVGELGDPAWTNSTYGAPATTLEAWLGQPQEARSGLPH